jgi:chromosome segregation ATPase
MALKSLADIQANEEALLNQKATIDSDIDDQKRDFDRRKSICDSIKREVDGLIEKKRGIGTGANSIEARLQYFNKSALSIYQAVNSAMRTGRTFRGEVVGPLLVYITRKNGVPEEAGRAIEKVLGSKLESFIVTW